MSELAEIVRFATQPRATMTSEKSYLYVDDEPIVKLACEYRPIGLMSVRFAVQAWGQDVVNELFMLADNDVNAL